MGFRVGRKHAQHVYPEPVRTGGAPPPAALARNFAQGPAANTPIVGTTAPVPWTTAIESGAPLGIDVPITPTSAARRVLISAVVVISNSGGADIVVSLQAQVGGVIIPGSPNVLSGDILPVGFVAVPYSFVTTLPAGTSDIEILVTVSAVNSATILGGGASTLELQELSPVTG